MWHKVSALEAAAPQAPQLRASPPSRPPHTPTTPIPRPEVKRACHVACALHVHCTCTQAQQHLGRVERVNEQLKELYGPLLACVTASKSAYDAMVQQVGGTATDGPSFRAAVRADEASPEGVAYRAWVEEVLLPLSDRAARLIVERADLLEVSQLCTTPPHRYPIYRHPVTAPPPPYHHSPAQSKYVSNCAARWMQRMTAFY